MRFQLAKTVLPSIFVCIVLFSCVKEVVEEVNPVVEETIPVNLSSARISNPKKLDASFAKLQSKVSTLSKNMEFSAYLSKKVAAAKANNKATSSSTCVATPFFKTVDRYFSKFGPEEINLYGLYTLINVLSIDLDQSKQYFGDHGEETHTVAKHQKKLERFYDLPERIVVKGEHNSTLNNRNKVAAVYKEFGGYNNDEAYDMADEIIAINKKSAVFIETPLLSLDAYTSPDHVIVIGDGIVRVLSETGIESDVATAGLLAHEWAHQVQYHYSVNWFGMEAGEWPFTLEFIRAIELEADYFSGYYLTQKKGATHNWKKAAQFFYMFYNIGDCNIYDEGHHGTPNQRLAAARLGYILAEKSSAKGHIISADDLNAVFNASLNSILNNKISVDKAYAGLKTAGSKAGYKAILQYKNELQLILNGKLTKSQVENL